MRPWLLRAVGAGDWREAEYPAGDSGFDFEELQAMGGGTSFEAHRLDEEFSVICDEGGRLKGLPVVAGLELADEGLHQIPGSSPS